MASGLDGGGLGGLSKQKLTPTLTHMLLNPLRIALATVIVASRPF